MSTERSTRETEEETRQGVTGHNVRYVLLISCTLVVMLMIVGFSFRRRVSVDELRSSAAAGS
ncbi:hypothetical protein SAMN05519103_08927 [Rhizobiales bacterium GAS113]|nr:hypothetical protein SAMN05519103_08927 [Rhizobiales bacterium GAS113]